MTELTLQLFSARNTELDVALQIIAAAGYKSVEAYSENLQQRDEFKNALQRHDLKMVSAHISLDQLENNLPFNMELLAGFGASHMVCPYLLPEHRPADSEGWIQLAQKLDSINNTLVKNGFTFAWHNHDFELQTLADGGVPMQLLLDYATQMHWELDIGWIVRAGCDPSQWLQQYTDRISAFHIKDVAQSGECLDEDGWADVGFGVINWTDLLTDLKKTSAMHFIVEHDNPADLKRFVENSYKSIQGWAW